MSDAGSTPAPKKLFYGWYIVAIAAVAQTGSILVSSDTCGGRAISILPHVHVVVATADQVVPALADALDAARSSQRLRTALSLEGEWLPAVLRDAHARLAEHLSVDLVGRLAREARLL